MITALPGSSGAVAGRRQRARHLLTLDKHVSSGLTSQFQGDPEFFQPFFIRFLWEKNLYPIDTKRRIPIGFRQNSNY
jgi:hypothetical protein